jgi:predicted transcriptional regulator
MAKKKEAKPRPNRTKTTQLVVRMTPEMDRELRHLADKMDLSISQIIRHSVAMYVIGVNKSLTREDVLGIKN